MFIYKHLFLQCAGVKLKPSAAVLQIFSVTSYIKTEDTAVYFLIFPIKH